MENSLYAFAYTPQVAIIRPYLPLYTCTRGSITRQTNVSRSTPRFRASSFFFLPFSLLDWIEIWNLLTDSNRQRLLIWLLIGKFVSKLDQLEDSQTRRERKFLFDWFLESFFITNKILSKFSREKGVIKTFLILQS